MSTLPSVTRIRTILDEIKDPCSVAASTPMGLDEMGLVRSLEVDPDGRVAIVLRLTSPFCEMVPYMRNEAIARIEALPGVTSVVIEHDSGLDWEPELMAPSARRRQQQRLRALQRIVTEGGPGPRLHRPSVGRA